METDRGQRECERAKGHGNSKKMESKQAEEGKRRQIGLYYPVNHSSFASDKEYH